MIVSLFSLLILTSSISLILFQNFIPVTNIFAQKSGEVETNPLNSEMKKKLEQKMLEIFGNETNGQEQEEQQSTPSSSLGDESMLNSLINQKILDNKVKNEKKQITIGKPSQQQKSTYDNVIVNFSKSSTTDYKFGIFLADGGQVSATLNIKPDVTYTTTAQDRI
jgi:hypothetical protein